MSSRWQKLLARVNWYLLSSFKHITEKNTGNHSYHRGGRYRQVSLYKVPCHYMNQCGLIVNGTTGDKLPWNLSHDAKFSITKMHFKMSSAKWWPFCSGIIISKAIITLNEAVLYDIYCFVPLPMYFILLAFSLSLSFSFLSWIHVSMHLNESLQNGTRNLIQNTKFGHISNSYKLFVLK